MLRKITKEMQPELKALVADEATRQVVIGNSLYEMAPMGLRDTMFLRTLGEEFFEALRANGMSIEILSKYLIERGILNTLLKDVYAVDPEDITRLTMAQAILLAEAWLTINFFSLPPETLDRIFFAVSYLSSTLLSLGLSHDNTQPTMNPENPETPSATVIQTSPMAS